MQYNQKVPLAIKIAAILFALLFCALLIFFLSKGGGRSGNRTPLPSTPSTPVTSTSNFKVLSTNPADRQTNIYPGEIEITINTDQSLFSDRDFSLEIQPKLPFLWKFTNSYPTKTLTAKVLGKLETSTTYKLTLKSSSGVSVYSWSFTTAKQEAESSSALVAQYEQNLADQYYPLSAYTPFENSDFFIGYKSRLNLNVYIKNPNVSQVKQEVLEWIRSHGVDPSTHTINYINNF